MLYNGEGFGGFGAGAVFLGTFAAVVTTGFTVGSAASLVPFADGARVVLNRIQGVGGVGLGCSLRFSLGCHSFEPEWGFLRPISGSFGACVHEL